MYDYGLILDCPAQALATESIPVRVEMRGDRRTYWDTDSFLDKALNVAVLRRDRPGVRLLAKVDPRMWMLPDEPLEGRPSDEELDASMVRVVTEKVLDAASPEESHRGAAEYFVTGAFSKWWGGIRELKVTDPRNHVAPWEAPRLGRDGRPWRARPRAKDEASSIHLEREGAEDCLAIPIAAGLFAGPAWAAPGSLRPWLSIVGFNLCTRGGACGGDFAIEVDKPELAADVLLPLTSLAWTKPTGDWLFLAVVGGQLVAPNELHLKAE